MIFISYTHKDGEFIDIISQKLSQVFGREKVFYDKWSIQPGDGIINKMNEGLNSCKFFFFFVSNNSLNSNLVKTEWQNALLKATNNQIKFIPVKLDDCSVPDILLQTLYIDIFNYGIDVGIRQIIDVINGDNVYRPSHQTYENIRGYITEEDQYLIIEFRAETYLEPQSRYCILLENDVNNIDVKCQSDGMLLHDFQNNYKLGNGLTTNILFLSVPRGTSPGFPFIVKLNHKEGKNIEIKDLMRAISLDQFKSIPIEIKMKHVGAPVKLPPGADRKDG